MANTYTDQYGLVKLSTVEIGFPQNLWGKTINYNDGFSRELFRVGRHIGSIRSDHDAQQAHRGDTVLTVNLGLITLKFSGFLPTQERKYTLSYDAAILTRVWDARTFAVCYQQGIDPLDKVREAIHAVLVREVARQQHDKVTDEDLRYDVENLVGVPARNLSGTGPSVVRLLPAYGVAVVEAQTMAPHADPKRLRDLEEEERVARETQRIDRDTQIELARRDSEDTLAQRQRLIDARQRDEHLEDDAARRRHEIQIQEEERLGAATVDLRITAGQVQLQADLRLLERLRGDNWSTAQIREEYSELAYLLDRRDHFTPLPPVEGPARLASLPAGVSDASREVSSQETFGVASEERDQDIRVTHLGIKMTSTTLDDEQMELSRAASRRAYLITGLITEWPGVQSLKVGDILVRLDDEPVGEVAELTQRLDRAQGSEQAVKVEVLRGEQTKALDVLVPAAGETL